MARILVIDDSSFQRMTFKHLLLRMGHEPILAENGGIGLLRAVKMNPAAILLDLNMPIIDGFQLLEQLRKRDIDVPAAVISADDQEVNVRRCRELGAHEFITKPVQATELAEAIERMLGGRRKVL
ncbi:MAG: CheY-like chemotaxis protein [Candidatus Paceibacteria bacterium]|jgi:CheY-like chemotaxis protein